MVGKKYTVRQKNIYIETDVKLTGKSARDSVLPDEIFGVIKKREKFYFSPFHFSMSNIVDIWLLKFSISPHHFSQWGLQKRVRNNELVFAVAKQFLFSI